MSNQQRNLHPHAEARLAMAIWGEEYSKQRGGSMDFWDGLSPFRKSLCVQIVDGVLKANEENGRAALAALASDGKRGEQ